MNKIQGVKEWAEASYNILSGCEYDCLYCYGKADAIRFKRKTAEYWHQSYLKEKSSRIPKLKTVMYPSVHDITKKHLIYHISTIHDILYNHNKLIIVSKPNYECIVKLCKTFNPKKDNILFRFTIGSLDDSILSFWEPRAPDSSERLACLKYAYLNGFKTSVSMEPFLNTDIDQAINDILHIEQFVNEKIWIGKMNQGAARLTINGHSDKIPAFRKLDEYWNQDNLKKLQSELPFYLRNKIAWKENCIKQP